MAAELVIAPEALADLEEAYAWYEAQRFGRGEDFLGRVDASIQAILRFPENLQVHSYFTVFMYVGCLGTRSDVLHCRIRLPKPVFF